MNDTHRQGRNVGLGDQARATRLVQSLYALNARKMQTKYLLYKLKIDNVCV